MQKAAERLNKEGAGKSYFYDFSTTWYSYFCSVLDPLDIILNMI